MATRRPGNGKGRGRKPKERPPADAKAYDHKEEALLRPEVGIQAQFKQRKPPAKYRYDSSLDPQLSWDEGNAEREHAEALIREVQEAQTLEDARAAARELAAMSRPFLIWAGKAERGAFEVPTLPLFIHDRLSTKAILETLKGHRPQQTLGGFFGDPGLDIVDRQLKAYEHPAPWTNRLILGDSLVVMNSLLKYEGLGGQVQMIYMDPPYGVKFGSNFQPFVRSRSVDHGRDEAMSREPEMVQAYRDTWDLGLHSYLSYLRDRVVLARELLSSSGSLFVQISNENVHHVRELLDEVMGPDNAAGLITFVKTSPLGTKLLAERCDYILWYAKDKERLRFHPLFAPKVEGEEGASQYDWIHTVGGEMRRRRSEDDLQDGDRLFTISDATAMFSTSACVFPFEFQGEQLVPPKSRQWQTTPEGMKRLANANRLILVGNSLRYARYLSDFPANPLNSLWTDTGVSGFSDPKLYVVQTNAKVIARCLLMTTDPGDLVLDPTCGSGTTAYVAEQWGRRWITIDTSRVPIALAKQRLLTATFPYYELQDEKKGPAGGFVYRRRQNRKGEEVGGIVPHVTLKSIAQGQQPEEEILVDRPEIVDGVVRVAGPFTVEAVIPTPLEHEATEKAVPAEHAVAAQSGRDHLERMLDTLRRAPVLQLPKGKVIFENVRRPVRSLDLHAVADQDYKETKAEVAFVFGPENGAVSEKLVFDAIRECNLHGYMHLYVIGFAIQDAALKLIQRSGEIGVPATYVAATMDILMGEDTEAPLLKTNKHSQVFSVTGQPDVRLVRLKKKSQDGKPLYHVELHGLDTFDPVTMDVQHLKGDDVPAWFLDANYNDLSFWVSQAFFPRTGAWDNLKKALKGYSETVWDHLAGTVSEPFSEPETGKVAVKAIDVRGNELLVVLTKDEALSEG